MAQTSQAPRLVFPPAGKPRIVIIDDNVRLAQNLRDVLAGAESFEADIELAEDAAAGLRLAREGGFDVAVVDVKLPDASGVELVRPLREASPGGEIVLVTGYATLDTAVAALGAGASAFILKSFRPGELLATVEQALERARLRREREAYARRYRALAEVTHALIAGFYADARAAWFNRHLAELTRPLSGDRAEDFVGEWIVPEDRRSFRRALEQALVVGEPIDIEAGLAASGGRTLRVLWHLAASTGPSPGEPVVLGIGVDVTERRALERRVAEAEALNAMAPLALGLAHEIRNPLNAATLQLHLLGRSIAKLDADPQRDAMVDRVAIVESEIRRLERLLSEFLELARPRAPQRERVDLAKVVAEVLDLELEAMSHAGITLERALEPRGWVLGDVEKLKQCVLNLVVNALDAMPDGGRLLATVERADGWLSFVLQDSGPGIEPRHEAELFDPFFTTKPAGTGLGLSIVRKIVAQHGGAISLTTRSEGGTEARISLPAADSSGDGASGARRRG